MLDGTSDTLAEVDEAMTRTLSALAKEDCFTSTDGVALRGERHATTACANHEAAHRGRVHGTVRPCQGV